MIGFLIRRLAAGGGGGAAGHDDHFHLAARHPRQRGGCDTGPVQLPQPPGARGVQPRVRVRPAVVRPVPAVAGPPAPGQPGILLDAWTRASPRCSGIACRRRSGWSASRSRSRLSSRCRSGCGRRCSRNGLVDYTFTGRCSFLFYAAPTFFVGTVLILVFSVKLHIFGPRGPAGGLVDDITDWRDLTLPVVHAGAGDDRALLPLHALGGDRAYSPRTTRPTAGRGIRTAVLWRHVRGDSLIPIATLLGLSLAGDPVRGPDHRVGLQRPGHGLPVLRAAESKDYPTSSAPSSWSRSPPWWGRCSDIAATRWFIPE